MSNTIKKTAYIFLVLIFIFVGSCKKDKIYPPEYEETEEFYTLMNQWYFWKDSIGDVSIDGYSNPNDLLSAMRYTPRDKWSYISTKTEHTQYYEEGSFVGYGFGYSPDGSGNMRITFVFEDSYFYGFGIRRGWIIRKINGTVINENSNLNDLLGANEIGIENLFEFESLTSEIVTKTISKKLVKMNTILHEEVISAGTSKVGYFVFKSFIGPSKDEIAETLGNFKTQGIDELVIDLRYNGGGRIDIVNYLAGLIIPDNSNGKLFYSYIHNSDRSYENTGYNFEQEANSLRLDKVYFIADKGSASASELLINGLDPYIDVYIVGNDTYGKPVGMYSFESEVSDLMYVPVTFMLTNADGYGAYYNGLKADSYVDDDVESDFGIGEAILDEVLLHVEFGSFSSIKSLPGVHKRHKEIRNLKDEIGAL